MSKQMFISEGKSYMHRLSSCISDEVLEKVYVMAEALKRAWEHDRQVFLCGNGGSAANALHIANDFLYGVGNCGTRQKRAGLRVEGLPGNQGILTCLANDTGYENIYSKQLEAKCSAGDILIVLSGSGNSGNIVKALETAKGIGAQTFAILAFDGGKSRGLADVAIHLPVDDMQIAEDLQLVVAHLCMQWLCKTR